MKHPERVEDYLAHIIEASKRALSYLHDVTSLNAFENDIRNQDAVVRNIEIIGEAATKIHNVAPDFTTAHPDIPWAAMRAMRNIITHEYFSVNLQIVWDTVKNDLPMLLNKITPLLSPQQTGTRSSEHNSEQ
jgi:uncharacterized protein with HEPN domain